ncbi:hypothetical protein Fmac_013588 [Flemingia macrophylla]|uniref:RRM domain-containing protein n=1 Tax=Flemingia macrophylla TaxID=520843 RepID=A0ABD1MTK2_9FABA
MAKANVLPVTACPPQYVSLRRVQISKPSMWVENCATIPSLSISASAPLLCCSSTSNNFPSSPKIFVKGLPLSTSEGRLTKVFSEFGEVTLVQLPIDRESGKSLGFAFIWFANEDSAQLAVQEMNGKFFDGRFIYVTIAKPRSSKSSKSTTAYKF